jgi:hypothetical protein
MPWHILQKRRFRIISGCAIISLACASIPVTSCLAQYESEDSARANTPPIPGAANKIQKHGSTLLPIATSTINAWCAAATSLPFPSKPVHGRILNDPFTVERAYLTYDTVFGAKGNKPKRSLVLTFRQGAMNPDNISNAPRVAFDITFFRGDLAGLAGKTIVVNPYSPVDVTKNYPMVTVATNVVARQRSPTYTRDMSWPRTHNAYLVGGSNYGYGMRLTFGKMQSNRLPGYIVLRIADKDHSFVEGYFYATVKDAWAGFENLQARREFPSGN